MLLFIRVAKIQLRSPGGMLLCMFKSEARCFSGLFGNILLTSTIKLLSLQITFIFGGANTKSHNATF